MRPNQAALSRLVCCVVGLSWCAGVSYDSFNLVLVPSRMMLEAGRGRMNYGKQLHMLLYGISVPPAVVSPFASHKPFPHEPGSKVLDGGSRSWESGEGAGMS